MLSVQVFGPGGNDRNTAPEYFGLMGVAHGPLRRRHSGKGRAIPERLPVDRSFFVAFCGCTAAAAAVNKQSPAPQQDTDAPVAQPARKAAKDAKALPPRKHTKTDTSEAEKEPRGQKSLEALARAALANVDANRPASNDALIEPGLADTRSVPGDTQPRRANVPPRHADVGPPQPVAVPPNAAGIEAAPHAADVQPQPVEISPATGADLQPRSPDVRSSPVAPVDIQRRPITGADPLPPRTNPPLEISAPQQPPTADQDKGVFSALKRIPDLMRPDPPAPIGETPRPPMPVGPASPEIK